jgi:peroxiredoxin
MKRNIIFLIFLIVAILVFIQVGADTAYSISIGEPFPPFTQTNTLDIEECSYLGIDYEEDFSLNDLRNEVIVVELLNAYCDTCRLQVEVFNDLFLKTKKDPEFSGKVSFVGIATGNSFEEVRDFKEKFGALYPIIADQQRKFFTAIGGIQRIPYVYVLRKDEKGFVLESHTRGGSSKDKYLSMIRFVLRGTMSGVEQGNKAPEYTIISGGKSYDEKSFEGKRIILYFPVDKKYPLAIDTRNTENQVKILHKILNTFPDVIVILFESPGLSLNAEILMKSSSFYIAQQEGKNPFDTFRSPNEPTLYYINEFGRVAFRGDSITLHNAQEIMEGNEYTPTPDMEEEDITYLIEEHIEKFGEVVSTEKFMINNEKKIYITPLSPKNLGVYLFSRLESSPSLCDVCHDSHFIYIIDQKGIILDFIPVQLTKKGNISWSEKDVQKVKDTFVGRSIFEDFRFNPKVDAISTATLTASLVFEAFNQGKAIFRDFKYYKFRWKYWEQICHKNYCNIIRKIEQLKKDNKDFILNDASLYTVMSEYNLAGCPLHGKYIVIGGDIVCSVFGMHTHECEQ